MHQQAGNRNHWPCMYVTRVCISVHVSLFIVFCVLYILSLFFYFENIGLSTSLSRRSQKDSEVISSAAGASEVSI